MPFLEGDRFIPAVRRSVSGQPRLEDRPSRARRCYSATIRGMLAIGSIVMLRNQVSAPSDWS
jgi:hypothetical protein